MDRQIGVQIEGERYIRLVNIDKERHGKLKFTTIKDGQRRAVIKVFLFENDSMKPLKEIEVGSLPPEKAGVPEIGLSTEFDGKKTLTFTVTLNGRSRSRDSVIISRQPKGVKKSLVLIPVAIIIIASVFFIVKKTTFFKTVGVSGYPDRKELAVETDRPRSQQKDDVKTEKNKRPDGETPSTVEKESSREIRKTTKTEESSKSGDREKQPEEVIQPVKKEMEVKSPNSGLENNHESINARESEEAEISDPSQSNEYVRTDVQEEKIYETAVDVEKVQSKTEIKDTFTENDPLKIIFFEPGRAVLSSEALEELDKIIPFLKKNRGKKVIVSGHCALYSSEEGRLQLSEMRASNVYWYLRDRGWKPRTKPDVTGFGGSQFVTAAQDSQHLNRRVEIRIED